VKIIGISKVTTFKSLKPNLMKTRRKLKLYRDSILITSTLFIITFILGITHKILSELNVGYFVLSLAVGIWLLYEQDKINRKL
tara:strand:+ start:537 stop:785 length:249 start_codon:yes stop_codon:yes gene_type:complete